MPARGCDLGLSRCRWRELRAVRRWVIDERQGDLAGSAGFAWSLSALLGNRSNAWRRSE